VFIEAKDDGSDGDSWSYKSTKLQSNRHHQQTVYSLKLYSTYALPAVSHAMCCRGHPFFHLIWLSWRFCNILDTGMPLSRVHTSTEAAELAKFLPLNKRWVKLMVIWGWVILRDTAVMG